MSATNQNPIIVERDGIRVEKRFITDKFKVPVVEFIVDSTSDEPIKVRILDSIPSEFDSDSVGFHPDHEGEFWEALENNRVGFERPIKPNETVSTIYGIDGSEEEDSYMFEKEPTVYVKDIDPSEVDMDMDNVEMEGDEMDELEGDGEGDGERQPTEEKDRTVDESSEAATDSQGASGVTELPEGISLTSLLAKELESGRVDNSEIQRLTTTLESYLETPQSDEVPESINVQLDGLQARVAEFENYIDALQEFIDENGRGQAILREVQSELDEIREDVSSIDTDIDEKAQSNEEAIDELETDIENIESRFSDVEETVQDLTEQMGGVDELLDDEMEPLRERIENIETEFDGIDKSLESELESMEKRVESALSSVDERVKETIGDVEGQFENLDARIDDVADELEDAQKTREEARELSQENADEIQKIASEVEELDETVSKLKSSFDTIRTAFGAQPDNSESDSSSEAGDGTEEAENESDDE